MWQMMRLFLRIQARVLQSDVLINDRQQIPIQTQQQDQMDQEENDQILRTMLQVAAASERQITSIPNSKEKTTELCQWSELPFHVILHILDFVQFVVYEWDCSKLIGRFRNDPFHHYRLIFRSIECAPDITGLDSVIWRLLLSQVRHISLLYYSGIRTRRQPLFVHLDSYASSDTMPQLKSIDIDERTHSMFQSLQWKNNFLLNRVRHISLLCSEYPTSPGLALRKFPRIASCVVDNVSSGDNALMECTTLRELRTTLSLEQLKHVVQRCKHITDLRIEIFDDHVLSSDWIPCLRQVHHIKRLHLNAPTILHDIERIPYCPSLIDLSILGLSVKSFEGLQEMKQLVHLTLDVGSSPVSGIQQLAHCTNLRTLALYGDDRVESSLLDSLITLASIGLRSLIMDSFGLFHGCWILGDKGVQQILSAATALESFTLRDKTITARILASIVQCHSLENVQLHVSNSEQWSDHLIRQTQRLAHLKTFQVSEW